MPVYMSLQSALASHYVMSVGNKVMDIVSNKKFLNNVKKLSKYFLLNLNKIKEKYPSIIKQIRG